MGAKNILITGCNRGIGLALVKYYLNPEYGVNHLIATCRNPEQAEELNRLAESNPQKLHLIRLDLTDHSSFEEVYKRVDEIVGESGLNLLINNAGIGQERDVSDSPELMRQTFEVNCIAPYFFTEAMLPALKEASLKHSDKAIGIERAAILMISTGLASIGTNNRVYKHSYRCSKAALNMATKNLSLELNDEGILVLAMNPGWVKTEMGGEDALVTPEQSAANINSTLNKINQGDHGLFKNYDNNIIPW